MAFAALQVVGLKQRDRDRQTDTERHNRESDRHRQTDTERDRDNREREIMGNVTCCGVILIFLLRVP